MEEKLTETLFTEDEKTMQMRPQHHGALLRGGHADEHWIQEAAAQPSFGRQRGPPGARGPHGAEPPGYWQTCPRGPPETPIRRPPLALAPHHHVPEHRELDGGHLEFAGENPPLHHVHVPHPVDSHQAPTWNATPADGRPYQRGQPRPGPGDEGHGREGQALQEEDLRKDLRARDTVRQNREARQRRLDQERYVTVDRKYLDKLEEGIHQWHKLQKQLADEVTSLRRRLDRQHEELKQTLLKRSTTRDGQTDMQCPPTKVAKLVSSRKERDYKRMQEFRKKKEQERLSRECSTKEAQEVVDAPSEQESALPQGECSEPAKHRLQLPNTTKEEERLQNERLFAGVLKEAEELLATVPSIDSNETLTSECDNFLNATDSDEL